jgi:hypothetical protein
MHRVIYLRFDNLLMSAVYIKTASQVTMTVSRLPVVAVNGPVEINCINATAALSGLVLKRQLLLCLVNR